MKLARVLILVCALVFIIVGAFFLLAPEPYAKVIEISASTAMARTELRATYGGLELGFGVFLVLCATRRDWLRPGLWAVALAIGGFATGRLIGFAFEGTISPLMLTFLTLELIVTLLAVVALRR